MGSGAMKITVKVKVLNEDDLTAKIEKLSELLQQFKELSESLDIEISYELVKTQDQIDLKKLAKEISELQMKTKKEETRMENELEKYSTEELVQELVSREGVETSTIKPNAEATIKVSGPAIVLVVVD